MGYVPAYNTTQPPSVNAAMCGGSPPEAATTCGVPPLGSCPPASKRSCTIRPSETQLSSQPPDSSEVTDTLPMETPSIDWMIPCPPTGAPLAS